MANDRNKLPDKMRNEKTHYRLAFPPDLHGIKDTPPSTLFTVGAGIKNSERNMSAG